MPKSLKLIIWLFPLAAIALSCWLGYRYFQNRGPEISIEFVDASGIEANRTKVFYRGIIVGNVEKSHLNTDGTKAIAVVRMANETQELLKEKTRFVIVQPQVGFEGVSGLETLVKGPTIILEPGDGKPANHFTGIEKSQLGTTSRDAVIYHLETANTESLGAGDPIYFRGAKIGSIVASKLNANGNGVILDFAINKEYVRVIRDNTRFWQKRAVEADMSLFGSDIKIGSLETLMKGGINVATPNPPGAIANRGSTFTILQEEPESWREWTPALTF